MVNRYIRLPLGVQQLGQGVEIVLARPIQISQFPSRIVPLPRHHEPLLLVLVEVVRVELTGSVRVYGGVQPRVLVLVDVVLVPVAVQVQVGLEALPGSAISRRGMLTVVLVEGEDGQDVFGGELDVALDSAVQSTGRLGSV